ncbi:MAG: hypothetical protein HYS23_11585 [Geobacter sp.]|nr:hypothetical protein [Geobacter sp.]
MKGMPRRGGWLVLALLLMVATGCAPALQNNQDELNGRAKRLKNIVMLSPDTCISELTAGGVKEKRDDWCVTGQSNVERAIIENLQAKHVNVKVLKAGADLEDETDDIKSLYRAVMESIYTHAQFLAGNNINFFPERRKNFDYSVGSLEKLLKKQKADGLLLVHAEDEISSSGRKALRVVQAINPFGVPERAGTTSVEVALADRKGDILWYALFYESGGYDLREFDSTKKFVNAVLEDFPAEGK